MGEVNWELIVHRLDEIAKAQEENGTKLVEIQEKLGKIDTLNTKVDEINTWKEHLSEVVSISEIKEIKEWKKEVLELITPTQLKTLLSEIEKIKTFKTQSTMAWAVVQAIVMILLFWKDFF